MRAYAPPVPAQGSGRRLNYFGSAEEASALAQRRISFVAGGDAIERTIGEVSVDNTATQERPKLHGVFLNGTVDYKYFPNRNPDTDDGEALIEVFGNLVDADQGRSEEDIVLGNGDNREIFQTFELPAKPLTYHIRSGATPPEVPELDVYVDDRRWSRVDTFFGRGPEEEIYVVREDAVGSSWLQFGDGNTGKRLPTGRSNVKVAYRTGIGAFGEQQLDTTAQPGERIDRLDKVLLPGVVSGGAQPEQGANARRAAPGKTQSLGRLVSLRDIENETLGIAGVAKAQGTWAMIEHVPGIRLTVLMEQGREAEMDSVRAAILEMDRCRGANRFPIVVTAGVIEWIAVRAQVAVTAGFRPELVFRDVARSLGAIAPRDDETSEAPVLFSLMHRALGQDVHATQITAAIQRTSGVSWVRLAGVESLGPLADPTSVIMPELLSPGTVITCDSDRILQLHSRHLHLGAVSGPEEVC